MIGFAVFTQRGLPAPLRIESITGIVPNFDGDGGATVLMGARSVDIQESSEVAKAILERAILDQAVLTMPTVPKETREEREEKARRLFEGLEEDYMPGDSQKVRDAGGAMQWPLGVQKEMDDLAKRLGLTHWSCTSPLSNTYWLRRDGVVHRCNFERSGWPEELRSIDIESPMDPFVFGDCQE